PAAPPPPVPFVVGDGRGAAEPGDERHEQPVDPAEHVDDHGIADRWGHGGVMPNSAGRTTRRGGRLRDLRDLRGSHQRVVILARRIAVSLPGVVEAAAVVAY